MIQDKDIIYFIGDPLEVAAMLSIAKNLSYPKVILCNYENYSNLNLLDRTKILLESVGIVPISIITVRLVSNRLSFFGLKTKFRNNTILKNLNINVLESGLTSGMFSVCAHINSPIWDFPSLSAVSIWRMSHSPAEDIQCWRSSLEKNNVLVSTFLSTIRYLLGYRTHLRKFDKYYTWIQYSKDQSSLSLNPFIENMKVDFSDTNCDTLILFGADNYSNEGYSELCSLTKEHLLSLGRFLACCEAVEIIFVKFHPVVFGRLTSDQHEDLKNTLFDFAHELGFHKLSFLDDVFSHELLQLPAEIQLHLLAPKKIIGSYSSALLIPAYSGKVSVISDSTYNPSSRVREAVESQFLGDKIRVLTSDTD